MKLKYFCSLIGIDVAFLISLYVFLLFIVKKLQSFMFELQSHTAEIGNLETAMTQNMSLINIEKLGILTENLKGMLSGMLFYFFIGILGAYLLYCLFQGINWSLAYNFLQRRVKVDKKYLLKFSLVSIGFLTLGLYLFYHILVSARFILLSTLVSFDYGSLFKLIGFSILWILLIYFSFISYTLLIRYDLGEAIKHILENLKTKTFLYFLLSFFGVLAVIYLFLQVQFFNIATYIVEIVLISLIVEKYRVYLLKES